MTPEDWKQLQPGDRLRENDDVLRGRLWRVMEIKSSGVTLWCSVAGRTRFVLWAQLEEMTTVWQEGKRAPTPRSLWERLLTD